MQDGERPADVEPLAQPAGACRPRVEAKSQRGILRVQRMNRIRGHRGRRRHLREGAAIRPPELERAVGPSRDPVALFVDRVVMAAAQEDQVAERGRAALGPVTHVMTLSDPYMTAREATAPVPM